MRQTITVFVILLALRSTAAELHVPSQYATITGAVEAATSGDTIRIGAGDYYEQLLIVGKTNLTLVGEPGTVLHATSGMTRSLQPYRFDVYAVVGIHRSDVVISSLAIVGDSLAEPYGRQFNGVVYYGAGGMITNCVLSGFRASGPVVDDTIMGKGLHCFNPVSAGTPAVNVAIVNNTFTNNSIGIHLRGDPGANPRLLRTTAKVQGNRITGFGAAPEWIVGIWIVCGVAAEVIGNHISDFAGTTTWESCGIAAYDAAAESTHGRFVSLLPTKYEGNTFTNNGEHLLVIGGDESQIVNNKFVGTVAGSVVSRAIFLSGTNIVVANNNFSDLPTAIFPVGDDIWPSPWPALPRAANTSLRGNWFCNVPQRIRHHPLVTGLQEQGTESCENGPFRPTFQLSSRDATAPEGLPAPPSFTLRSWHGQPVIIESSTNLQHWVLVHTNAMTLPSFKFAAPAASATPRQFYRARQ